jgi:hypothetical protein
MKFRRFSRAWILRSSEAERRRCRHSRHLWIRAFNPSKIDFTPARREAPGIAPTKLAPHTLEEAAPIAFPAPAALSVLITVGRMDRAPVMRSNQATPGAADRLPSCGGQPVGIGLADEPAKAFLGITVVEPTAC